MRNPVMPSLMAGLADDAGGIVTAAGEDEGHAGVGDEVDLVTECQGATWSLSVETAGVRRANVA